MPEAPHYDPNQPRVPRGQPDGGQWTDSGNGQEEPAAPPDHARERNASMHGFGASVQPVQWQIPLVYLFGDIVLQRGLAGILAYFAALSAYNNARKQAIIGFNARKYQGDRSISVNLAEIGYIEPEDFDKTCKALKTVQDLTNNAVDQAGPPSDYRSAANYGTAVHRKLELMIEPGRYPTLRAEKSYAKVREEAYGDKTAFRVDVIEQLDENTVCVYDIKTGKSGLTVRRMGEIATYIFRFRDPADPNKITRIIVTEVRPTNKIQPGSWPLLR